jgi:hypothetical protein
MRSLAWSTYVAPPNPVLDNLGLIALCGTVIGPQAIPVLAGTGASADGAERRRAVCGKSHARFDG